MIQKATALNASVAADAKQPLCKNNKESIAAWYAPVKGSQDGSLKLLREDAGEALGV